MAEKLYTTAQAARAIGVSRQTLHTWLAEGRITVPKLGTNRIWTQSQVDELKKERSKAKKKK